MRIYPILLLLILLAFACLDEIDLAVDQGFDETIAIEGRIVKGNPSRVLVGISRLFDFAPDSRKALVVLEAIIRDSKGNELPLELSDRGRYSAEIPEDHPTFKVTHFESYQIDIRMANGKRYVSDLEPLLPVPAIENIRAIRTSGLIPDDAQDYIPADFISFELTTPLSNPQQEEKVRLRWEFEHTFAVTDNPLPSTPPFRKTCYITQKTGLFHPQSLDANTLATDRLDNYSLHEEIINHHFAEGYVLHVYQESLSSGAHQYWEEVESILGRSGNMFEAAPGRLQTNIRNPEEEDNNITGYFYATEIDTFRIYVSPAFAEFPDTLCIPLPEMVLEPHICLDCLVEPRSTMNKPSFWPE